MKLFVHVFDGPSKDSYGIVEHYDGNNVIIVKLYVNMPNMYACPVGWEQVKRAQCNILGYFPEDKSYNEFLEYINTLPTCAG